MSDTKIKTYKNHNRGGNVDYKPYVPQYQIEGIEPSIYSSAIVPDNTKIAKPDPLPPDNPRAKRSPIRQQVYSNIRPKSYHMDKIINVGNNMEHVWSNSVEDIQNDFDVESDEGVDLSKPMIDNNEYYTDEALKFQSGVTASEILKDHENGKVEFEQEPEEYLKSQDRDSDLFSIISDLSDSLYLLIVNGTSVCSGPQEEIEEQARALVFGEHQMCGGNPTPIEDIVIVKKVKMKIGLFLE